MTSFLKARRVGRAKSLTSRGLLPVLVIAAAIMAGWTVRSHAQESPTPPAVLEAHKQLVKQFNDSTFGSGRDFSVDNLRNYLTPDFVSHDPIVPSGLETLSVWGKNLMAHTPVGRGGPDVMLMLAEGDYVAMVMARNMPWPDGPEPTFHTISVDVYRIADGKIAEFWSSTRPPDAAMLKAMLATPLPDTGPK